jgi:hypothetical protein
MRCYSQNFGAPWIERGLMKRALSKLTSLRVNEKWLPAFLSVKGQTFMTRCASQPKHET